LHGIKIIEFAALGPAPMGAMLLADLGATVLRIERKSATGGRPSADLFDPKVDILNRNRQVIALDLKRPEGIAAGLQLIAGADALIEGFRPGVMERLGLAPDVCLARNPRLVYGRMTGWGQTGTLSQAAGHDINYLSLSGALHAIGERGGKPVVPLNLVADGGGAMLLALGILAALLEARVSGQGQVVDAAMTDGCATLMTMVHTFKAMGQWTQDRGSNVLDGGAHFYDTYRCRDGKYIAIGPIEPQFYALFLEKTGITDPEFKLQWDQARWPTLKERLRAILLEKTRDEWCGLMEGSDACVTPVLDMDEARQHPHNLSRNTFIEVDGVIQPAPAPRFSRTAPDRPTPPTARGVAADILHEWGFGSEAIAQMEGCGAI
jgi:alpha-methylacyl-CoA racemase